jgi:hypothetical protein
MFEFALLTFGYLLYSQHYITSHHLPLADVCFTCLARLWFGAFPPPLPLLLVCLVGILLL